MFNYKNKSLDDLIKGIKYLLLENRCSFSEKEKVLLNDCIFRLQKFKEENSIKSISNFDLIVKVIEVLSKLIVSSEHLKNLF